MAKSSSLAGAVKKTVSQATEKRDEEQREMFSSNQRKSVKAMTLRLNPEGWKQLRQLGLDTDRSSQDLLTEALNDLFVKYNKPPVA